MDERVIVKALVIMFVMNVFIVLGAAAGITLDPLQFGFWIALVGGVPMLLFCGVALTSRKFFGWLNGGAT